VGAGFGVPVGIVVVVVVVVLVEELVPVEAVELVPEEVVLVPVVEVPAPDEEPVPAVLLPLAPVVPLVDFSSWVNGLRDLPVSLPWLGAALELTTGTPAGAGSSLFVESCATGVPPPPPLESSTGTAIKATSSSAAIGHRRFSRRSLMIGFR
jgi:hypothetical protein